MRYNFAAESFYIMKLFSRLYVLYCRNSPKDDKLLDKIGVKVKAFADDVKIYVRIVNDIDCDVLQRALDSLQQWANMWQVIISVNKCCVLNIGNPRLAVNVNIDNSALPQPSSVLDLGITTTSNLSPSTHIRNIVCKANSRAIAIHHCHVS